MIATGISAPTFGNWQSLTTVTDSDTLVDGREHSLINKANELESINYDTDSSRPDEDRSYDDNGNLATISPVGSDDIDYYYDAWNRLVKIEVGGSTIAEYRYNALHWQVLREIDLEGNGVLDERRLLAYSPSWQLLEERVDFAPTPTFSPDRIEQQVWGKRMTDDAVYRRVDDDGGEPGPDQSYDRGFFYVTDALGSVVAVLDDVYGRVHEQVRYDAYGLPELQFPEDVALPYGVFDFSDTSQFLTWYDQHPDGTRTRNHRGDRTPVELCVAQIGLRSPETRLVLPCVRWMSFTQASHGVHT